MNSQTQISFQWIKTNSLNSLSPITQVYGICFNEKNEILICRRDSKSEWQLPGGKPKNEENLEETLQRELLEEVNTRVQNIQLLGVLKVNYPNNPNKFEGQEFYQVRMICEVSEILSSEKDPSTGIMWERKFVPFHHIHEYIKWGKAGEEMFNDIFKARSL